MTSYKCADRAEEWGGSSTTSSAKFTGLILNAGYLSDSEPKYKKKNLDLDMNKTRNNGNPSVFCSSG